MSPATTAEDKNRIAEFEATVVLLIGEPYCLYRPENERNYGRSPRHRRGPRAHPTAGSHQPH